MEISIFDIIVGPCQTSKAYFLNQRYKQVVLWVHPDANKRQIIEALEKLFKDVRVRKVRTIRVKGKFKMRGRVRSQDKVRKKAIITFEGDVDFSGLGKPVEVAPVQEAKGTK